MADGDPKTTALRMSQYARRPEVIALAKFRMDQTDGRGTWDECEAAVFDGLHSGRAKILDRLLSGLLNQAERDIADVKFILGIK